MNKIVISLLLLSLVSCNPKNRTDKSSNPVMTEIQDEQAAENPYGWIDSFPQKIKSLQKSFYKYDVKSYQCSLIDEFFYDRGTKVNITGLVGIDTTLCQTLFGNAISVNDIICNSYLYSIDYHNLNVIKSRMII